MTPCEMMDRFTDLLKEWDIDNPVVLVIGENIDAPVVDRFGAVCVIGGGPDISNTIYDHLIVRAASHLSHERAIEFEHDTRRVTVMDAPTETH